MATERQQKKGKDKWREKVWYSILTPAYLGEKEIATSPAIDPKSMVGRKIEMPVSDMTGNFKKTNLKMVFKVDECQGNRCFTSFVGSYVSDDSIRRMVRRRKERIDVIEKDYTHDGYLLAVKVVGVSDVKLISNKRADIRLALGKFLREKISTSNLQDLVSYLIGDEVLNEMSREIRQIYTMKKLEIRKTEVLGFKKPESEQVVAEVVA
jgi:small subunit ribosomal protein S3Ae